MRVFRRSYSKFQDNPAITEFLSLIWCNKSQIERCDDNFACLVRYFDPDAKHFVDYVDKNWFEEPPYTGACLVGILPSWNDV